MKEGSACLKGKKVEEPRLCAEIILAHLLNLRRIDLYLYPEKEVAEQKKVLFKRLLARRIQGEPLQYLTGEVTFCGLVFRIKPGVFIPRPETELLVSAVGEKISGFRKRRQILEVGTGCGAVGLTLAKLFDAEILLIDKSLPAVKIARENRRRLRIESNRSRIQQKDFSVFTGRTRKKFEVIVSNPPYIPRTERRNLSKEVRREPHAALFGGPDGLSFIRVLIKESFKILAAGGYLIFEIGYGQAERVIFLLGKYGFKLEKIIKDPAGIDRVVVCQKHGSI
ncbi:MAG: peptide chain release factor N(5)-glutamine methyltransferase [Candidatus Omnitrophica bacterium]|nr:peptide chain release factor N(5)-glutamine methyltransferase [Candidatus Omnitrophota bacterium]